MPDASANPSGDEASIASRSRGFASRGLEPLDLLAVVATFGTALWVIDPIYDINDVFWHVLIGDQILNGVPFSELGSNFSFAPTNDAWRTGAWASEVLQSWLHTLGGWELLVNALRLATVFSIAIVFWQGVVRRFPSRAAVLPYLLAMMVLVLSVQERPQSVSFVFIAIAGLWWYKAVENDRPVAWWAAGLASVIWANFHGLWVMLPIVLAVALIGRMLDNGLKDPLRWPLAAAFLASVAGGAITPLGLDGLLLPIRIQGAAKGLISEWELTSLIGWPGYTLLIAGGLAVYLVGRVRGSRAEVLFIALVLVFGLMAVRNVAPAVLLLTPLLASLMTRALGPRAFTTVSPVERIRLKYLAIGLAATGLIAVGATVMLRAQGLPEDLPIAMAERLQDEPGEVRVFNDFNLSGISLFYGGENVKVAVDGRTDFYGSDYLDRYQDAVLYGKDLNQLLDDLDPSHAFLHRDSGAAAVLLLQGWEEIDTSDLNDTDEFVLLRAP